MRTIVVGVDGSAAGDEALRWAMAEARQWEGNVVAIHAWEPLYVTYPVPGAYAVDEAVLETEAKQLLIDSLARTVAEPPFGLHERVVRGRAADVLLEAAGDADLSEGGRR